MNVPFQKFIFGSDRLISWLRVIIFRSLPSPGLESHRLSNEGIILNVFAFETEPRLLALADPQSSVAGIPAIVQLLAIVVAGVAADELLAIPK